MRSLKTVSPYFLLLSLLCALVASCLDRSLTAWHFALFLSLLADVHRFDAEAIPLDGPYGLLVHVERLLDDAPGLEYRRKRVLLERFRRVVQDSEMQPAR